MAGKALATKEDFTPLAIMHADPDDLLEIIETNLGGSNASAFDLHRVSCPTGGGMLWEVPDIDEEDGVAHIKELTGIVLAFKDPRTYWAKSFDETGGGEIPDCSSPDGKFGFGTPGGDCSKCPMAQFGSINRGGKAGRGQACKQTRVMLLLREDSMLPIVVTIPPTSLRACRKFFMDVTGRGKPIHGALIGIKLHKAQSRDGISYSEYSFRLVRWLQEDEHARAKGYTKLAAETLSTVGQRVAEEEAA